MTGISIIVELDDEAARNNLREMVARMERPLPFYTAVGNTLVSSTGERFRAQVAPDGTPWTPLKQATIRARLKRGGSAISILRDQGHLIGSINAAPSDDDVRIGSASPYAAIHQLGGIIEKQASARYKVGRRFAKRHVSGGADVSIAAHRITIPARPYLGISKQDEVEIFETAADWLTSD